MAENSSLNACENTATSWMCICCLEPNSLEHGHCNSCGRERDPVAEEKIAGKLSQARPLVPWNLLPPGTVLRAPDTPVLLRSTDSPRKSEPDSLSMATFSDTESTTSSSEAFKSSPHQTGQSLGDPSHNAKQLSTKLSAAAPEFYPVTTVYYPVYVYPSWWNYLCFFVLNCILWEGVVLWSGMALHVSKVIYWPHTVGDGPFSIICGRPETYPTNLPRV